MNRIKPYLEILPETEKELEIFLYKLGIEHKHGLITRQELITYTHTLERMLEKINTLLYGYLEQS